MAGTAPQPTAPPAIPQIHHTLLTAFGASPLIPFRIFELAAKIGPKTHMSVYANIIAESFSKLRKPGSPAPKWAVGQTPEGLAEKFGCSARMIEIAIADFLDRGLIEKHPNQNYAYRVLPGNLETARDYEPAKPQPITEAPPPEPPQEPQAVRNRRIVVMPGERSQPMLLDEAVAATLKKVDYENGSSAKLRFEHRIVDGWVTFAAFDIGEQKAEKKRTNGAEKRNAFRQQSISSLQTKDLSNISFEKVPNPDPLAKILNLLGPHIHRRIIPEKRAEIQAALGDAPIALLEAAIEAKINASGGGYFTSYGLVAKIAREDVRPLWIEERNRPERTPPARQDRRENSLDRMLRIVRDRIAAGKAPL